jgi:thioesterase domain-containing protein
VAVHPIGTRRPFFCVHGIGGEVLCYAELARHLGSDQPFYGLQALRSYADPHSFPSVEAMARHYLQELRTVQPEGPYRLGGYSSGGTVAYEMAQQLHAQGQQVALLAVLDHGPCHGQALLRPGTPRWLAHFLRNVLYWLQDDFLQSTPGQLGRRLRLKLRGHLPWSGRGTALEAATGNFHAPVLDRLFDMAQLPEEYRNFLEGHYRALRNYVPRKFPGRMTLLRARTRPLFRIAEADLGWRKLVQGGVDIRIVPGSHSNILKEPYVRGLAQVLRQCLDQSQVGPDKDGKQASCPPAEAELEGALVP